MILVGLTGSIGMGKSTTAGMFARLGAPIYDADAEVRRLYAPGGAAVAPIEAAFPGVTVDGGVDRNRLAEQVLGNPVALSKLNGIVWPLMGAARQAFLQAAASAPFAILDIPLLLETGGEKGVDVVVVVSASAAQQKARVLARPGMSETKFAAIAAAQMPDAEKRAKADYVIDTGQGLEHAREQVAEVVKMLQARAKQETTQA